jgi:geranylgeranyl diphosphate synthase, type II
MNTDGHRLASVGTLPEGQQNSPPDKAHLLNVPQDRKERDGLRDVIRNYVSSKELAPPLSLDELRKHADSVITISGSSKAYRDFVTVLVENELWRETVAEIPFERRILLLPQCLRSKKTCPAQMDELGLLCEQCGRCPTGDLQSEAEKLGYSVLIAEGTTVVTNLIERGKADAIIGVSCLAVLERAFPHMAAGVIPGIAIPLLTNGCERTTADIDWIREAIHLRISNQSLHSVDVERIRAEVESWFEPEALRSILKSANNRTAELAVDWLSRAGKRWRPLLTVCVHRALVPSEEESILLPIRKLAIATECFHKASLIHDDIEDADDFRYGEMTMHKQYGVPIALNVGDFLIGEGYRLIVECGAPTEQTVRMLAVATEAHRNLCTGQGEELLWKKDTTPPNTDAVLEVFRHKTAPAFEVALRLGAICAGGDEDMCQMLKAFSESLGITYQLRDDIEDHRGTLSEEEARQLFEQYRNQTLRSLNPLKNASLRNLLRKAATKIVGTLQPPVAPA